jgi:ABC-type amino acid transport substrate-binding protein
MEKIIAGIKGFLMFPVWFICLLVFLSLIQLCVAGVIGVLTNSTDAAFEYADKVNWDGMLILILAFIGAIIGVFKGEIRIGKWKITKGW